MAGLQQNTAPQRPAERWRVPAEHGRTAGPARRFSAASAAVVLLPQYHHHRRILPGRGQPAGAQYGYAAAAFPAGCRGIQRSAAGNQPEPVQPCSGGTSILHL